MVIICPSLLSVIVMLVISLLFCKMSSELQKRKKKVANITDQSGNIAMAPDTTPQIAREPIYDDIELTDKTRTIDLSKNVAYVSVGTPTVSMQDMRWAGAQSTPINSIRNISHLVSPSCIYFIFSLTSCSRTFFSTSCFNSFYVSPWLGLGYTKLLTPKPSDNSQVTWG